MNSWETFVYAGFIVALLGVSDERQLFETGSMFHENCGSLLLPLFKFKSGEGLLLKSAVLALGVVDIIFVSIGLKD